jgi:hypothetical protein
MKVVAAIGVIMLWTSFAAGCDRNASEPAPTSTKPSKVATPAAPVSASSPPPADPQPPASKPPAATALPEAFCAKLPALVARCKQFAGFAATAPERCVHDTDSLLARRPDLRPLFQCAVDRDDCKDIATCFTQKQTDPTRDLRTCHDTSRGISSHAVGIPRAEWVHRNGAGVTRLRDARSTAQAPIEMCGVDAANEWLTTLTCNDGSRPIKSHGDAELARAGNAGQAGRCGSFIDDYRVRCSESTYQIFIDAYICPLP